MTTAIRSFPQRKQRAFLKTAVLVLMMSISMSYVLGLPANTQAPWNRPGDVNSINDFNGNLNVAFPLKQQGLEEVHFHRHYHYQDPGSHE